MSSTAFQIRHGASYGSVLNCDIDLSKDGAYTRGDFEIIVKDGQVTIKKNGELLTQEPIPVDFFTDHAGAEILLFQEGSSFMFDTDAFFFKAGNAKPQNSLSAPLDKILGFWTKLEKKPIVANAQHGTSWKKGDAEKTTPNIGLSFGKSRKSIDYNITVTPSASAGKSYLTIHAVQDNDPNDANYPAEFSGTIDVTDLDDNLPIRLFNFERVNTGSTFEYTLTHIAGRSLTTITSAVADPVEETGDPGAAIGGKKSPPAGPLVQQVTIKIPGLSRMFSLPAYTALDDQAKVARYLEKVVGPDAKEAFLAAPNQSQVLAKVLEIIAPIWNNPDQLQAKKAQIIAAIQGTAVAAPVTTSGYAPTSSLVKQVTDAIPGLSRMFGLPSYKSLDDQAKVARYLEKAVGPEAKEAFLAAPNQSQALAKVLEIIAPIWNKPDQLQAKKAQIIAAIQGATGTVIAPDTTSVAPVTTGSLVQQITTKIPGLSRMFSLPSYKSLDDQAKVAKYLEKAVGPEAKEAFLNAPNKAQALAKALEIIAPIWNNPDQLQAKKAQIIAAIQGTAVAAPVTTSGYAPTSSLVKQVTDAIPGLSRMFGLPSYKSLDDQAKVARYLEKAVGPEAKEAFLAAPNQSQALAKVLEIIAPIWNKPDQLQAKKAQIIAAIQGATGTVIAPDTTSVAPVTTGSLVQQITTKIPGLSRMFSLPSYKSLDDQAKVAKYLEKAVGPEAKEAFLNAPNKAQALAKALEIIAPIWNNPDQLQAKKAQIIAAIQGTAVAAPVTTSGYAPTSSLVKQVTDAIPGLSRMFGLPSYKSLDDQAKVARYLEKAVGPEAKEAFLAAPNQSQALAKVLEIIAPIWNKPDQLQAKKAQIITAIQGATGTVIAPDTTSVAPVTTGSLVQQITTKIPGLSRMFSLPSYKSLDDQAKVAKYLEKAVGPEAKEAFLNAPNKAQALAKALEIIAPIWNKPEQIQAKKAQIIAAISGTTSVGGGAEEFFKHGQYPLTRMLFDAFPGTVNMYSIQEIIDKNPFSATDYAIVNTLLRKRFGIDSTITSAFTSLPHAKKAKALEMMIGRIKVNDLDSILPRIQRIRDGKPTVPIGGKPKGAKPTATQALAKVKSEVLRRLGIKKFDKINTAPLTKLSAAKVYLAGSLLSLSASYMDIDTTSLVKISEDIDKAIAAKTPKKDPTTEVAALKAELEKLFGVKMARVRITSRSIDISKLKQAIAILEKTLVFFKSTYPHYDASKYESLFRSLDRTLGNRTQLPIDYDEVITYAGIIEEYKSDQIKDFETHLATLKTNYQSWKTKFSKYIEFKNLNPKLQLVIKALEKQLDIYKAVRSKQSESTIKRRYAEWVALKRKTSSEFKADTDPISIYLKSLCTAKKPVTSKVTTPGAGTSAPAKAEPAKVEATPKEAHSTLKTKTLTVNGTKREFVHDLEFTEDNLIELIQFIHTNDMKYALIVNVNDSSKFDKMLNPAIWKYLESIGSKTQKAYDLIVDRITLPYGHDDSTGIKYSAFRKGRISLMGAKTPISDKSIQIAAQHLEFEQEHAEIRQDLRVSEMLMGAPNISIKTIQAIADKYGIRILETPTQVGTEFIFSIDPMDGKSIKTNLDEFMHDLIQLVGLAKGRWSIHNLLYQDKESDLGAYFKQLESENNEALSNAGGTFVCPSDMPYEECVSKQLQASTSGKEIKPEDTAIGYCQGSFLYYAANQFQFVRTSPTGELVTKQPSSTRLYIVISGTKDLSADHLLKTIKRAHLKRYYSTSFL